MVIYILYIFLIIIFNYYIYRYSQILGGQKQNKGTETTTSTSKGGVLA